MIRCIAAPSSRPISGPRRRLAKLLMRLSSRIRTGWCAGMSPSPTSSSWRMTLIKHDGPVPRPWRLAFQADPNLPTIVHLLLGMNAHINYDLPQATLSVITDQDFEDPVLIERRRRDHERIDMILASRVTAEDHAIGGRRSVLDRLLTPANRLSSRRFLREARQKVWLNVAELQQARLDGRRRLLRPAGRA